MEYASIYSLLTLGFGLGLVHALDADHIMAVSSLTCADDRDDGDTRHRSGRKALGYCFRWAIGHGAIVLALGLLFILTQTQLPAMVVALAEKLVGLILIALGCWIIYTVWRNRLTLLVHRHGDITHVHLSVPGSQHTDHRPLLIGPTHGLAGSAPALALIPVVGTDPTATGILTGVLYIALFCLGVLIAMLVFGFFLGQLQNRIARFGQRLFHASRLLIASASIGIGSWWLLY